MIIRYTTPTVIFSYSDITVSSITKAYLTIKQRNNEIITKDITTATVGSSSLSWTLSQAETALLTAGVPAQICCDWLLNDGTRGRSDIKTEQVENTGKAEVISNE